MIKVRLQARPWISGEAYFVLCDDGEEALARGYVWLVGRDTWLFSLDENFCPAGVPLCTLTAENADDLRAAIVGKLNDRFYPTEPEFE